VRVEREELSRIRDELARRGRRYGSSELEGAIIDCDYALDEDGFADTRISETGVGDQMVVYTCRPDWRPIVFDEVIDRLEATWTRQGAFKHEAHMISQDADGISLDFVTWWDNERFYTGRIEVALPSGDM
jgi:hypothetical protein